MDRWRDSTAVVTGASSGIGEALVKRLARHGLKVVALARRKERLQALEDSLTDEGFQVKGLGCDVAHEDEVKSAFSWIEENWGQVNILVNNAGVFPSARATDEDLYVHVKHALDVNVLGLTACSSHAIQSMKRHGVTQGHIININSVAGHRLIEVDGFIPYCTSKHAVTVITAQLRGELGRSGDCIRVTSISPGLTRSEMANGFMKMFGNQSSILETEDVVDAIEYCLSAPPRVNISELTIQPLSAQIINEHMVNGNKS